MHSGLGDRSLPLLSHRSNVAGPIPTILATASEDSGDNALPFNDNLGYHI